jgi:hypothetical protein
MTSKSARREYLEALSVFERACIEFSQGMGAVLEPAPPEVPVSAQGTPQPLLADLGPRKPAKRAPRSDPHAQPKRAY